MMAAMTIGWLCLISSTLAHMEMSWPYAIRSKFNPNNSYQVIDYSMTSPLFADGSNFPCKGYQNDRPAEVVAEYTPGGRYNISLAGTATHGGGSCQISLSYDNGATFRVIKSMIGGCPLKSTYDFDMPTYVPQGQALLAWTWQNKLGNREYYMNCAEVKISGQAKRSKRDGFNNFDDLPLIWKANVPGVNTCVTSEGEIPVYPEPGPQVTYADGMSTASRVVQGDCNAAKPFGKAYKALGDTSPPDDASPSPSPSSSTETNASTPSSAASSFSSASAPSSSTSTSTTATNSAMSTTSPSIAVSSASGTLVMAAPQQTSITQTSTEAPENPGSVVTKSIMETEERTTYTTISETVATSTLFAQTLSVRSMAQEPLMSSSPYSGAMALQSAQISAVVTTTVTLDCEPAIVTVTVTSVAFAHSSPQTAPTATRPSSSSPSSYASGNLSRYLPCVPGTFVCTSDTTFYTCDYDTSVASTEWSYSHPRQVAAGMECLPSLSPYTVQTSQNGQQANTPPRTYRDDRIVRSRPFGNCDVDGAMRCADGGTTFQVCDQGGWVDMGSVAAGTICSDGNIVAR